MRRTFHFLACCAISIMATAQTQTLDVSAGSVTYRFPSSLAGDMHFMDGSRMSVMGHEFLVGETDRMLVSLTGESVPGSVTVSYEDGVQEIYVSPEQMSDAERVDLRASNVPLFTASLSGLRLHFGMEDISHVEIESVDAYGIAGSGEKSILTFSAPSGTTLAPGKDYYVTMLPSDLYGGYRLSIYRKGQVAHYFGVHQVAEAGGYITPADLDESELEFDDPDAPLVEEERPELDKKTKELLRIYKQDPSDENYQALYDQMGVRYDKVVARKKAKLRELEREAHHQSLIDEMQGIVDEMVVNREERLQQRFISLIDSRTDDNPDDAWCVLKGAWEENAYIGYTPVTNAEYAAFLPGHSYPAGEENHPVTNVSIYYAMAYCSWLSQKDSAHDYRLPSEYEWILAAGHMPKDVAMNADHVEAGLTPVDAYAQSVGNCGGIDFWGNCWEWTTTCDEQGMYLVKGGAWDTSRDECRSEYCDDARNGSESFANVGFRVVRVDKASE